MPQMFDFKDGLPKLSEAEVPAQQQIIDVLCKDPAQHAAAQKALDERDIVALQAAMFDWGKTK